MSAEVAQELAAIVTDRTDLPTICLILGDLFGTMRQLDKASSCWKTAIQRDERGGPVAVTAQGELARLKKEAGPQQEHDA
jgi:hypothetical protein